MDDASLHRRLDGIERRQSILLALIVGAYLLAGSWILVDVVGLVSPWTIAVAGAVGLVLTMVLGMVRRRRARA